MMFGGDLRVCLATPLWFGALTLYLQNLPTLTRRFINAFGGKENA